MLDSDSGTSEVQWGDPRNTEAGGARVYRSVMNVIIGITDSSNEGSWVEWDQLASDSSGYALSPDDGISVGDQRQDIYIDDEVLLVDEASVEGVNAGEMLEGIGP